MSDARSVSERLSTVLARLAALPAPQAADEARSDQDARWRAGECPRAESYLDVLPAVAADPEQALVLIYGEVLSRTARGESPTLAEYQQRFPQFSDRLANQFAVHDALAAQPTAAGARPQDAPTLQNDAAESDPGDFSLDVQQTISAIGPPGAATEVGRLGHYRVLRLLGEGGMGMVFLAQDTRLERPVALKVMRPSIAKNPAAHERFLREAKAAAAVKHDHIVTIYQVDENAGAPFLAMELLDGVPLNRWLKANPNPSLRAVVRIARETAEGLAAAHARGLIHRDIKPANLWIESPSGRVKILDFGLARPAIGDTQISDAGKIVGTPAYMAPEQARGEVVDHRADLFSLGVILYRMVTGKAPFAGDTVIAILTALAVATPEPVAALNPAAPPALAGLIEQLLAKKAADRPSSAGDVADALRRIESAFLFEALPRAVPVDEAQGVNPWRNIELTESDTSYAAVPQAIPVPEDVPEPLPPAPKPPAPKKRRPVGWGFVVIWGLFAVLTAGVALGLFSHYRGRMPTEEKADAGEKPKPDPKPVSPKKQPEPPPAVFVPPLDDGFSPLDNLDPAKIPASEKFPWQPKELVAVIGTHKMRHWGAIAHIVYSLKGDQVATVGPDGVRLWDAKTMEEKGFIPLAPRSLPLLPPSFAVDGRRLVVRRADGVAVVYDTTAIPPREVGSVGLAHNGESVAPDGKHFLSQTANYETAQLWDVSQEKPVILKEYPGFKQNWNFRCLLSKDRVLTLAPPALKDEKWRATLWDLSGESAKPVAEHDLEEVERAVSPDGKWFATSTPAGIKKVRVYDISGGKFEEKGSFEVPAIGQRAFVLQFVPGTSELYYAGDGSRGIRDVAVGETRPFPNTGVYSQLLAIAPGGVGVVRRDVSFPDRLTALDLKRDGSATVRAEAGPNIAVLPAPAANRVMTWEYDPHPARRWDLDGLEPKPLVVKQLEGGRAMTVLPDGRVVGRKKGTNATLCIFDPAKGDAAEPTVIPGEYDPSLITAHTSRSGRFLAVARNTNDNRTPTLIDLAGREPIVTQLSDMPPANGGVMYFDFSPSEQFLVAIGPPTAQPAHLWDLRGTKPKYLGALPAVDMASFALDAPTLVAGFHDGKVKLYDYSTGEFKETVSMQPFARPVFGAILLPGGKTVMAGDDTGHIKFLKVPTGEVEREWKWPGYAVLSLSNDGRHVYTQNANGTGYVLRLAAAPKVEPSPLDALDPKAIPAAERVPELPPDAVAVIGSHAGKHWGDVSSMACTPDGKLLATGGADGYVRLFDPTAGKELAVVSVQPNAAVRRVAFSADGRTMIACTQYVTKVWAVDSGKLTLRLEIPFGGWDAAISADATRLVVTSSEVSVVYDISGREPKEVVKLAKGHTGMIWTPVFLNDGKWVATTSEDKTVRIWDAASGAELRKFGPFDVIGGLLATRGGKSLTFVDRFGMVRTWDLSGDTPKESSRRLFENKLTNIPHHGLSLTPDGSKLACSVGNTIMAWDLTAVSDKPLFGPMESLYPRIALTADGKTLFASHYHGALIGVIDLTATEPKWKPILPGAEYNRPLGISPSGKLFAYQARSHVDKRNVWYDLSKNALGPPNPLPLFPVDREYFWLPRDPKSTALYTTASNNAEFVQYDLSQPPNSPPVRRVSPGGSIWCLHGSADGSTFAVFSSGGAGQDRAVVIYRPEGAAFKEVMRFQKPPDISFKIRLSADGRLLYFRDSGGAIQKWDVSGPVAREIKLPAAFAQTANWEISADGRRLVTMTNLGFTVWDITGPDPRPVGKVDGLMIWAYWTIAISPDGRQVVVGGNADHAGQRRYWYGLYDAATGDKRREWVFPFASYIQFAPDGRHLLTANTNGTGYVIRLQRGPVPMKP